MRKSHIVISILCYILFIATWLFIGFIGLLMFCFDFNHVMPFAMKIVFIILYFAFVTFPVYSKISHPKRAYAAIIATIIYILTVTLTYIGFNSYYSVFSSKKWLRCKDQRHLMIDSLESQYTLKGMNGDEIIELLGKPESAQAGPNTENIPTQYVYEYYIAEGWMDPIIYRIVFENGIVVMQSKTHT